MKKLEFTRSNHRLSHEQKDFIKTNWQVLTDIAIAKHLNTTDGAIRKLRHKMGLNKRKVKKYSTRIPLIIWMPRKSREDFDSDCLSVSLEELLPNDS